MDKHLKIMYWLMPQLSMLNKILALLKKHWLLWSQLNIHLIQQFVALFGPDVGALHFGVQSWVDWTHSQIFFYVVEFCGDFLC